MGVLNEPFLRTSATCCFVNTLPIPACSGCKRAISSAFLSNLPSVICLLSSDKEITSELNGSFEIRSFALSSSTPSVFAAKSFTFTELKEPSAFFKVSSIFSCNCFAATGSIDVAFELPVIFCRNLYTRGVLAK